MSFALCVLKFGINFVTDTGIRDLRRVCQVVRMLLGSTCHCMDEMEIICYAGLT